MKKQRAARYPISILCLLTFCFVLSACGTGGADTTTTSAPLVNATPTPIPPTPTPTVTLSPVTGDGYTIGSPAGWTSKKSTLSSSASLFQLSQGGNDLTSLVVETVTATAAISPAAFSPANSVKGGLSGLQGQAKNFQAKSVPATVTIGNIKWDQGAATTGDPASGTNSTFYFLSTKFPGNANKLVTIICTAKTSDFDKANTESFQPMLLSFKFA